MNGPKSKSSRSLEFVLTSLPRIKARVAKENGGFAAKIGALRELDALNAEGLRPCSVRILRNYTIENFVPLLRYACYESEIKAEVAISDFGTFEQEIVDPYSETYTNGHSLIILALNLEPLLKPREVAGFDRSRIFEYVSKLMLMFRKHSNTMMAVTQFTEPLFDITPSIFPDVNSLGQEIAVLNAELVDFCKSQQAIVTLPLPEISSRLGEAESIDRRFWFMASAPFKNRFLDLWAQHVTRLLRASFVPPKKVLVLDCDNTLWGGIIGEDGINDIALDPYKYPGSAFYAFQKQILAQKARGTIIAICSKNNESDVMEALDRHPHCLLQRDDIASFQINWEDKAANLRKLSQTLNVGLDSFVFIDDSLSECELIMRTLPEVAVIQVPTNTFELPSLLRTVWLFDSIISTAEDRNRAQLYNEQSAREKDAAKFQSLGGFLESLNLYATISQARDSEIGRLAQLSHKTNQFNLTTKRYTEPELRGILSNPENRVLTLSAKDRFGNYGLTGMCILIRNKDVILMDSFLMSCRILGKSLETALLHQALEIATKELETKLFQGVYLPTLKNGQVKNFFEKHGFSLADEDQSGGRYYDLVCDRVPFDFPHFITLVTEHEA